MGFCLVLGTDDRDRDRGKACLLQPLVIIPVPHEPGGRVRGIDGVRIKNSPVHVVIKTVVQEFPCGRRRKTGLAQEITGMAYIGCVVGNERRIQHELMGVKPDHGCRPSRGNAGEAAGLAEAVCGIQAVCRNPAAVIQKGSVKVDENKFSARLHMDSPGLVAEQQAAGHIHTGSHSQFALFAGQKSNHGADFPRFPPPALTGPVPPVCQILHGLSRIVFLMYWP